MRHVIQRTRIPKSKFKLEGAFLNQLETRLIARTPPVKSIRHLLGTFLNTTDQESGRALFTLVSKLNEAYFPAIRDMELVLTEGCNLACTYCFEGKMKRARTMKPDIARRAVDLLMVYSRNVEEISILFFGGEPFLNFKVLRIVTEYAEEQAKQHCKKLRFNCTSNCTNLTDEILGFVSQHRIAVLASVDGLQEAHDMYRKDRGGRGTFVRVLGNLKRLKLAQGYLGAKVTVMPANVSRLYDDVRGLYDHGITTFVIGYASGIKWPEESGKCYWNQLRKLKRWQSSESGSRVKLIGLPDDHPRAPEFRCKAGTVSISINPQGEISPCSKILAQDPERLVAKLGDVTYGLTYLRNRFELMYGRQLESACHKLKLAPYYSGGCIAENFGETGNLFKPGLKQYSIESLQYDDVQDGRINGNGVGAELITRPVRRRMRSTHSINQT